MNDLVDNFANALQALFDHCGYVEDWVVFPVIDCRKHYWRVDASERQWCQHSPKREALVAAIEERTDGPMAFPEKHGQHFYSSEIYTQRFLSKWVFRGAEFVLVLENPRVDGNRWLACYRADHEVTIPAQSALSTSA